MTNDLMTNDRMTNDPMTNDYKEILTINYELSAMNNQLSIIFTA